MRPTALRSVCAEWLSFLAANGFGFLVNYAVYATLIAAAPKPLNNPFVALAFGTRGRTAVQFHPLQPYCVSYAEDRHSQLACARRSALSTPSISCVGYPSAGS